MAETGRLPQRLLSRLSRSNACEEAVHASGHRDVIAEKCFAYATDCRSLSLILYDVTVRREALVVRLEV